ncbi:MAG: transposase [Armatimonadetes bacterium]|nr:transposase [Armatimonadota bacterium]
MKQTRFTEAQIVSILQEADANGVAVKDVCARHGICEQTFYR